MTGLPTDEVRGQLDVADAWGWPIDAGGARQIVDREIGLRYGLTHPTSERATGRRASP